MNRTAAGAALLLTATLAWGGMFPIADRALHHVDPFWLTAIRYAAASLLFAALLVVAEGRGALSYAGRFGRVLALGTAGFAGFNLLTYVGLEHTRPQSASLIVATMPLLTVLVVWARTKVRPPLAMFGFVVAALAGVALVISRGDVGELVHGGLGGGDLLVLLGAISWIVYTMGAAEFADWSPLRFTVLSAVAGTLSVVVITAVATAAGFISMPSASGLSAVGPALVYIVIAAAVVAVLAWNSGIRLLGPRHGTLFMNVVPITTFTIAIARGYEPDVAELVGAVITIAALVAANVHARRALAPAPAATEARRTVAVAG